MRKLVVGCGFVGLRIARSWRANGDRVFAVTRSDENARRFGDLGIQPIIADVTNPKSLARLPQVDTVLFAVGFDRRGSAAIHDVYVEGMSAVLNHLDAATVKRFIYLSSTGVYGQDDGSWVDEESPCVPVREGGVACLAAESRLRQHAIGNSSVILRLAGIYGPGRIPRKKDIESGQPFRAATEGYLNLIHVDDVVQTVLASEVVEALPKRYVVSDGCPVLRPDYYRELSRRLGMPHVRFEQPDPDSHAAQRARGSKRVCSELIQRELGLKWLYPNYVAGLAAIIEDG